MDTEFGFEDFRLIVGPDPVDRVVVVDQESMASFFVEAPSVPGDIMDGEIDWKGPLTVTECSARSLYDLVVWISCVHEHECVPADRGESIIGVEGVVRLHECG